MLRDLIGRWQRCHPWERLALTCWAVTLLVIVGRTLRWPHSHTLYPIFAQAGRDWLASADLYWSHVDPFRYSPLVAALFVPFALLPDWLGGLLWRGVSVAVYLGALAWWCQDVLPQPLSRKRWGILLLLILPLSVGNLNNGQANTLVLGLMLAAVAAVAGRSGSNPSGWNRQLTAGLTVLATLFKVYPIALGLLLVVVNPRRLGARLVLALAIGLALPFLFQQPNYVFGQYASWLHHLQTNDRQLLPRELWYRDFRLLCVVHGIPLSYHGYMLVQAAVGAAMAALCLAGRWAGWPTRRLLTLVTALGCCWMTVFGSATESSTYILLAPVVGWAVLEAWLQGRPWWLRGLILGAYVPLVLAQLSGCLPGPKLLSVQVIQPAAALVLLAGVLLVEGNETLRRWTASREELTTTPAAHAA